MAIGPYRVRLTYRLVDAVKPNECANGRQVIYDSVVPALAVRVTETGHKSFVLAARFPGSRNQTRRYLGDATGPRAISLAEARRKRGHGLPKSGTGIDPKDEIRRHRAAKEADGRPRHEARKLPSPPLPRSLSRPSYRTNARAGRSSASSGGSSSLGGESGKSTTSRRWMCPGLSALP
jgi:Arm DNA-binding domain